MLYKLAIDINETYEKQLGSPLYKSYRQSLLPLAIKFYKNIDPLFLYTLNATLHQYTILNISKLLCKK